jgi:hypothetical protein
MSGRWYSDWVCCCLAEPGFGGILLYLMRQSIYRSMSGRWYSNWICSCLHGGTRDFFYISWDHPFTGVWAGDDISTGSPVVWGSPGFLLYLMRQSLYRSMSERWYSDWFCCLAELGISSISHETIPLQEFERAMIFRLGLLLSGGNRDFFYFSWDSLFTGVWASGDIPTGSAAFWRWRKPGFLLYLMRPSLYRSMSERWYSDWVCCCLGEAGISSISHETIPLQEYVRAVIFRLGQLLSGGGGSRDFFYISWDHPFIGVW